MPLRILRTTAVLLFWTVLAGILLIMIAGAAGATVSPVLAYGGGFMVVLLPSILEYEALSRRRRRGRVVLTYIEQALRLNVPLPEFLAAAEQSERGRVAVRLRETREYLEAGVQLSVAIDQGVPELSTRDVALVAAAEQTGNVTATVSRLAKGEHPEPLGEEPKPAFAVSYVVLMSGVMALALTILCVFVLPKFRDIFRDFGIPLPAVTEGMLRFSVTAAPVAGAIVILMALVWIGRGLWGMVRRPRVPEREGLGLSRAFAGYVPLVGRVVRDRGLADVCRVMADGLAAGFPAPEVLNYATTVALADPLRGRVVQWAAEVHGGAPLAEGARRSGMPDTLVGLLASSRGGDTDSVFEFLHRYYAGRFSRMFYLLQGALVPVVVLVIGSLVGTIALALFIPIVRLIDEVQKYTGYMK